MAEKDIIACGDLYLDTDTDPKLNKGSDYILNTVITSDGRHAVAINCKGNEFISLAATHVDNITLMGSCADHARNRIILFTYSIDNSCISYLDVLTGNTGLILNNATYLRFNPSYLLYNPKVVGDLLYWTDKYNQPNKINYIRAYNYTNSVSTEYKYHSLDADIIKAYKKPNVAITIVSFRGTPILQRGKSYQWSYRYIYTDSEKSVLSTYTDIVFNDDVYYPNGEFKADYGTTYHSLRFTAFVEDVIASEIYVRDNEKSNWYLYDVVNRPKSSYNFTGTVINSGNEMTIPSDVYNSLTIGLWINGGINDYIIGKYITGNNYIVSLNSNHTNGTYSIYFTGYIHYAFDDSKLRIQSDQVDLSRPFDYIPLLAGHQELIEKNRLIYGDITEGYDPIDINVETVVTYVKTTISDDNNNYTVSNLQGTSPNDYYLITYNSYPAVSMYSIQIILSNPALTFAGQIIGATTIAISQSVYNSIPIGTRISYKSNEWMTVISKTINGTSYFFTVTPNQSITITSVTFTYYPIFSNSTYIDVKYVSKTGDTSSIILDNLVAKLISKGISDAQKVTGLSPSQLCIKFKRLSSSYQILKQNIFLFTYDVKQVYKTLKHYDSYLGGIRYYDKEFRFSYINKFDSPIKITDGLLSPNYPVKPQYAYVIAYIKNIPPDWAYYYSIDFTERIGYGEYWHIYGAYLYDFTFGDQYKNLENNATSYNSGDGYLRLKINNIINYAHDNNQSNSISSYTFEKGDRLRVIASSSIYGGSIDIRKKPLGLVNTKMDVEILRMEWPSDDSQYAKDSAATPDYLTDANGNKIKSDLSSFIVVPIIYSQLGIPVGYCQDFLFEIYRPKKISDNPLYFPCQMLEIGNPGLSTRYHKGITQHQNPSAPITTPAIVPCYCGDTYLKLRDCKNIYPCTDDNYSDYYTSNFYGKGIPDTFDSTAKRSNLTSGLRYSGILLENTKINELNKFLSNDLIVLKSEFGNIYVIKEVGDVLKVLQEKKENSIYVGKEEMSHADGSTTLITTDKVLGNIRRYEELRGTKHSKSVVSYDRYIYYWDDLRKEVIRSAPNGQIAISEIGMKTWFKNIVGYTDVISGVDETLNCYFITFLGTGYTLAFYEPKQENKTPRWISYFSFEPEWYISSGIFFASFVNKPPVSALVDWYDQYNDSSELTNYSLGVQSSGSCSFTIDNYALKITETAKGSPWTYLAIKRGNFDASQAVIGYTYRISLDVITNNTNHDSPIFIFGVLIHDNLSVGSHSFNVVCVSNTDNFLYIYLTAVNIHPTDIDFKIDNLRLETVTGSINGIYKHNSNSINRCIFYGIKYKQQINLYFNSNAAIKKLFKSIGIKSNKAWSVPAISIEADSSYPRGQLSKLNTNHFVLKEGDYFAEFLNNMLTTSSTASNLDLVEGDKLRGYTVKLQLENTENSEVWLLALEIQYEPSNLY